MVNVINSGSQFLAIFAEAVECHAMGSNPENWHVGHSHASMGILSLLTSTEDRCRRSGVLPRAQNLAKGPAEATVAERVQEWVNSRV